MLAATCRAVLLSPVRTLFTSIPGLQAGPDRGHVAVLCRPVQRFSDRVLLPNLNKVCLDLRLHRPNAVRAPHRVVVRLVHLRQAERIRARRALGVSPRQNTSGSFTAMASRMEIPPAAKYVTVSDSAASCCTFCVSMAASEVKRVALRLGFCGKLSEKPKWIVTLGKPKFPTNQRARISIVSAFVIQQTIQVIRRASSGRQQVHVTSSALFVSHSTPRGTPRGVGVVSKSQVG